MHACIVAYQHEPFRLYQERRRLHFGTGLEGTEKQSCRFFPCNGHSRIVACKAKKEWRWMSMIHALAEPQTSCWTGTLLADRLAEPPTPVNAGPTGVEWCGDN